MQIDSLNKLTNKAMPFITPLGMVIGLLLGERIAPYKGAGTYLFACMTFIGALGISFKQFGVVLKRIRSIAAVLICSHILIPVLVKLLASAVFPDSPDIVTGFVLLSSIPIAVTSFIWATIYSGNAPLALSLILIDTLLSPLLTPLTIRLLSGSSVMLDQKGMMLSLLVMIVIPSIAGMLCNQWAPPSVKRVVPYLNPLTKLIMIAVVILNVSTLAGSLTYSGIYIPVILVNLVLIVLGFSLIYLLAKYGLKEDRASVVSMTFTGGMRNISAALVLATGFFEPMTALPVVLGILFQQTFVGVLGGIFFSRDK